MNSNNGDYDNQKLLDNQSNFKSYFDRKDINTQAQEAFKVMNEIFNALIFVKKNPGLSDFSNEIFYSNNFNHSSGLKEKNNILNMIQSVRSHDQIKVPASFMEPVRAILTQTKNTKIIVNIENFYEDLKSSPGLNATQLDSFRIGMKNAALSFKIDQLLGKYEEVGTYKKFVLTQLGHILEILKENSAQLPPNAYQEFEICLIRLAEYPDPLKEKREPLRAAREEAKQAFGQLEEILKNLPKASNYNFDFLQGSYEQIYEVFQAKQAITQMLASFNGQPVQKELNNTFSSFMTRREDRSFAQDAQKITSAFREIRSTFPNASTGLEGFSELLGNTPHYERNRLLNKIYSTAISAKIDSLKNLGGTIEKVAEVCDQILISGQFANDWRQYSKFNNLLNAIAQFSHQNEHSNIQADQKAIRTACEQLKPRMLERARFLLEARQEQEVVPNNPTAEHLDKIVQIIMGEDEADRVPMSTEIEWASERISNIDFDTFA